MAKNYHFVALLVLFMPLLCICSKNPYKTLSVSKSASQQEIKQAYKKLAREWHPDKNSDPSASDRFMEIQESYEILSDDDKKREFDQFGYVDPNERRQQDPFGRQGHPFQHQNFDFGGGFNFKFSNSRSNDPRQVTFSRYQSGILPQSVRKPYLLLLTGNFCFNCMNVERVWSDIASEMESWGIGVGTVNIDNERRLASLMGIRHRPAIVGVIDGVVKEFGQGVITLQTMTKFVESILPRGLVQEVDNYNFKEFLVSFYNENKPRVLLFSSYRPIPLMFRLAALEFREFQAFGFASARAGNTDVLRAHIGHYPSRGAILVYKENITDYDDMLGESEITLNSLHHLLNSNKYLSFPRLSSQAMFEEMCPESPQTIGRRLCIVQITKATPEHENFRASFRDMALATPSWPHGAKLAYMLYDRQQEVGMAMEDLTIESDHSVSVAVIWRQRGNHIKLVWLPDGWEGENIMLERRAIKEFLYGLHDGTFKFSHKLVLPEFNDENAPPFYIKIMSNAKQLFRDACNAVYGFIFKTTWDSTSLLVLIMLVYAFFFIMAFLGLFGSKGDEAEGSTQEGAQNAANQQQAPTTTRQHDRGMGLVELSQRDYKRFVEKQKNSWHLLLLVREESKDIYSYQLSRFLQNYPQRIYFNFLCVDNYRSWYEAVTPEREEGTIIAVRFSKKYYCEFNPVLTSGASNLHSDVRRRHNGESGDAFDPGFVGLNDSDHDENLGGIYLGLNHWLDRLQDGSLPKTSVSEWPDLE